VYEVIHVGIANWLRPAKQVQFQVEQ